MKTKSLITSLAILMAAFPESHAAVIAYDGFSTPGTYTDGTTILTPGSGGTGWVDHWTVSGTPTGQFAGTTSGLSYSNGGALTTTAGAAVDTSGTLNAQMLRHFSDGTPYSNGTTLYFSFLTERTSSVTASFLNFRLLGGTSDSTRAYFQNTTSGADSFSIYDQANAQLGSSFGSGLENTTFFVVLRLDLAAGATDTLSVWLNPALNAPLGIASASGTLNVDTNDISGIRLTAGNSVTGLFDEIRVGTSFADVSPIPEPATWALMAASLTALMVFGRRRSI